jgi:transcriptional regulator with XRE-family HTH domain
MNFGDFIRNRRTALGLDQQTCAARSGIDASTVSRIENGRARPTLRTAIQVCRGMEVSLADLMDAWLGKRAPLQEPAFPGGTLLTPDDVQAFIEGVRVNAWVCCTWLADTLNRLVAVEGKKGPLFVPAAILTLLIDSAVYRFEITYPKEMSPATLISICRSGGMLTFRDIGHYLDRVRRGKSKTLAHLALDAGITPSMLAHIETGTLEQIKLADVLALDEYLEHEGMLLMLYWSAVSARVDRERHLEQKHEPSWTVYEEKLALILVTVYRWVLLKNPQPEQWVQALRQLDLRQEAAESNKFPYSLLSIAQDPHGPSATSQERE